MIPKLSELELTHEEIGRVFGERYSLIKNAGLDSALSSTLKGNLIGSLMSIGISAAAGLGIAGVGYLSSLKKHDKYNEDLKKSFSNTMKSIIHEPLKNNSSDRWLGPVQAKLQSDPVYYNSMAKDAFNVLASAAPDMALHPIIAKNFLVTTIYNDGEIPEHKLNTMSQISNNSSKNNYKRPSLNFDTVQNTFHNTGGNKAINEVGKVFSSKLSK